MGAEVIAIVIGGQSLQHGSIGFHCRKLDNVLDIVN